MSDLPDVLKIELRIEVNGQPLLIQAQVQGEGEAARRAAAALSSALTNVLTSVVKPDAGTTAAPGISNELIGATPATSATKPATAAVAVDQVSDSAARQKHPLILFMQRHRVRINLGFGGLLLVLAMLAPMIAPAAQRRDMLIVTLLLGLTAALMLFTAMLPGPERVIAPSTAMQAPPARPAPAGREQARRALLARRRSPLSAGAGLVVGVAFLLLGVLAPFTLGATTADERFIIMIGFSPIAVIGGFLVYIFWQRAFPAPRAQAQPAHVTAGVAGRRPPVTRAPQTAGYRAVLPALLLGLLVFVIAVVLVVVYGTVSAALR